MIAVCLCVLFSVTTVAECGNQVRLSESTLTAYLPGAQQIPAALFRSVPIPIKQGSPYLPKQRDSQAPWLLAKERLAWYFSYEKPMKEGRNARLWCAKARNAYGAKRCSRDMLLPETWALLARRMENGLYSNDMRRDSQDFIRALVQMGRVHRAQLHTLVRESARLLLKSVPAWDEIRKKSKGKDSHTIAKKLKKLERILTPYNLNDASEEKVVTLWKSGTIDRHVLQAWHRRQRLLKTQPVDAYETQIQEYVKQIQIFFDAVPVSPWNQMAADLHALYSTYAARPIVCDTKGNSRARSPDTATYYDNAYGWGFVKPKELVLLQTVAGKYVEGSRTLTAKDEDGLKYMSRMPLVVLSNEDENIVSLNTLIAYMELYLMQADALAASIRIPQYTRMPHTVRSRKAGNRWFSLVTPSTDGAIHMRNVYRKTTRVALPKMNGEKDVLLFLKELTQIKKDAKKRADSRLGELVYYSQTNKAQGTLLCDKLCAMIEQASVQPVNTDEEALAALAAYFSSSSWKKALTLTRQAKQYLRRAIKRGQSGVLKDAIMVRVKSSPIGSEETPVLIMEYCARYLESLIAEKKRAEGVVPRRDVRKQAVFFSYVGNMRAAGENDSRIPAEAIGALHSVQAYACAGLTVPAQDVRMPVGRVYELRKKNIIGTIQQQASGLTSIFDEVQKIIAEQASGVNQSAIVLIEKDLLSGRTDEVTEALCLQAICNALRDHGCSVFVEQTQKQSAAHDGAVLSEWLRQAASWGLTKDELSSVMQYACRIIPGYNERTMPQSKAQDKRNAVRQPRYFQSLETLHWAEGIDQETAELFSWILKGNAEWRKSRYVPPKVEVSIRKMLKTNHPTMSLIDPQKKYTRYNYALIRAARQADADGKIQAIDEKIKDIERIYLNIGGINGIRDEIVEAKKRGSEPTDNSKRGIYRDLSILDGRQYKYFGEQYEYAEYFLNEIREDLHQLVADMSAYEGFSFYVKKLKRFICADGDEANRRLIMSKPALVALLRIIKSYLIYAETVTDMRVYNDEEDHEPDGILRLENFAHPGLKDPVKNSVVLHKNDTVFLFGPNAAGKSTWLKALAYNLTCKKAQMHQTAQGVYGGDFIKHICLISSEPFFNDEKVRTLDPFHIFLRRAVYALQTADEHTFVLIDELGSGLDQNLFIPFYCMLLEKLAQKGATVICANHNPDMPQYLAGSLKNMRVFEASAKNNYVFDEVPVSHLMTGYGLRDLLKGSHSWVVLDYVCALMRENSAKEMQPLKSA